MPRRFPSGPHAVMFEFYSDDFTKRFAVILKTLRFNGHRFLLGWGWEGHRIPRIEREK